ncbi:CDP-glycerol glycerophosphotransferase family protein [Bacillus sp. 31A1R]|uniref:CDP-glycerol glycerophosphotransferase family protein n=1 Tax=Robertmurraya mangrovi TaxID=3098077 RepID=A0ABU5IYU4_9BACI|nr:CDP-glycerol glycerophosphotransferase family protein [Bacillus sp. 31A1R]MDZ5472340.1 CDP-glycerol glycerophosphotransferase family protein [Bacillus sp. 31A1R]
MIRRKKQLNKTCLLDSLYFKNKDLHIQMIFPHFTPIEQDQLTLLFVERYTTKKKEYPLSRIDTKVQACLTEQDLEGLLTEGKDWDLYVTHLINDSSERTRLQSNYSELELQFFLKDNKLLTPFTTNKGNISFKSQLPNFIAKIHQIDFVNKDHIRIEGYVVNPLWTQEPPDLKRTLVFSTNDDEYLFEVPLKTMNRFDFVNGIPTEGRDFKNIGYEAQFPIENLLSYHNQALTLKVKIKFSYSEGYKMVTTETTPIKIKVPDFKQKSLSKKVNGTKKLILITKTQKTEHLTISVSDHNFDLKTKLKETLVIIKKHSVVKRLYKHAFFCVGKLPSRKTIVVFESFLGKQFSDNPRAIFEYLRENSYPYKLYWSIDKRYVNNFKDKNLNCIPRFSLKWLFIMPRARYWVTNSRMPLWIPKPKKTVYFQTWHGTPLKRLAADMEEVYIPGTTAENYKKNFIKEAKNWDYLISPNAYSTEIFRRAFQFEKDVLETGYPRNDFIYNYNKKETIDRLLEQYRIPSNKKVILYAPTWRDNQFYAKGKYRFDIQLDLDLLKEKLGEDYVILFRLHYLVSENLDLTPYEGFAYDFSNYEDIRELYLLSDILITDYSSVFFDYGNLKRPMIFYVYDIDHYRDNLRGFYFDFEQEAPGPLVRSTEEIIQAIKRFEEDGFMVSKQFDSFYNKFCYLEDGSSTQRVVEKIFSN